MSLTERAFSDLGNAGRDRERRHSRIDERTLADACDAVRYVDGIQLMGSIKCIRADACHAVRNIDRFD